MSCEVDAQPGLGGSLILTAGIPGMERKLRVTRDKVRAIVHKAKQLQRLGGVTENPTQDVYEMKLRKGLSVFIQRNGQVEFRMNWDFGDVAFEMHVDELDALKGVD